MIAIINRGMTHSGDHKYTVQINHLVITEFTHSRSDGLAVCLERAAEAVRLSEAKQMMGALNGKD